MTPAVSGSDWSRAAEIVRSGGVLAFPTDTVFGLGCSIYSPQAIAKVLAIKGSGSDKSLPVLVASLDQAAALVDITPSFRSLARMFWPGALTIVAPALPGQPTEILAPDGSIGLRVPGSESVRRLIETAGCPIVGTSANRAGEQPVSDARSAHNEFGDEVDCILAGKSAGSIASTVVSLMQNRPSVLRVGAIGPAILRRAIPGLDFPNVNG